MCVASLRSMTMAVKAKNALTSAYIDCDIIKLEPYMTNKGCAYGVKFNCVNIANVRDALDRKNIKYTQIISLQ